MSDISVMKLKIEKLMALSKSPNVAEAAAALEKANKLLIQYNIELSEVVGFKTEVVEETYTDGYSLKDNETVLAGSVARFNLCELIIDSRLEGSDRIHKYLKIIGKEHNVNASKVMADYVFDSCDRASLSVKGKGRYVVHSFKVGFCMEMITRIDNMRLYNESQSQTSTALVLVENKQEVNDYMDEYYNGFTKRDMDTPKIKDTFGYMAGQLAAKNLSLNRELRA